VPFVIVEHGARHDGRAYGEVFSSFVELRRAISPRSEPFNGLFLHY